MTDHDQDHDNFSNVSWTEHADSHVVSPTASGGDGGLRAGQAASAAGKAVDDGLGYEKLECRVGSPLKENDGSKDAFISYLITTHVS